MQTPRAILDRINVWSVITTMLTGACSAVAVTWYVSGWYTTTNNKIDILSNRVQTLDDRAKARDAQTDINFKGIDETLGDLPYRVGLSEKAVEEANKRIDRVVDSFGGKLDKVLENQGKTDIKVEVLSSQVDDLKKTLASKIVWKEASLIPLLRFASLGSCTMPIREGFTVVKAHYRKTSDISVAGNETTFSRN